MINPPGQRAVGIGISSKKLFSSFKLSSFFITLIEGNSTSINKYQEISYDKNGYDKLQINEIFKQEKRMKEISEQALVDKRYYPGFSTFSAIPK